MTRALKPVFIIAFFAITLLGMAVDAAALSLKEAKSQGLLGEQANGYLGVVSDQAGAGALAGDINAKRRDHYQSIASRDGTTREIVEQIAGQRLLERAASGEYIRLPDGNWTRKP